MTRTEQEVVVVAIQNAQTHLIPNLPLKAVLEGLGYRVIVVAHHKPRFEQLVGAWNERAERIGEPPIEWVSAGASWSTSAWPYYTSTTLHERGNNAITFCRWTTAESRSP